jgi:hypothetical protein
VWPRGPLARAGDAIGAERAPGRCLRSRARTSPRTTSPWYPRPGDRERRRARHLGPHAPGPAAHPDRAAGGPGHPRVCRGHAGRGGRRGRVGRDRRRPRRSRRDHGGGRRARGLRVGGARPLVRRAARGPGHRARHRRRPDLARRRPGRRLRTTDGPWVALPVAPARVVVVPTAGCVDLVLVGRRRPRRAAARELRGAGRPPAGWASEGHLTEPVPTDALPADPLPADPLPAEPPAEPPARSPPSCCRRAPRAPRRSRWWSRRTRGRCSTSARGTRCPPARVGRRPAWRWSSRGGPPGSPCVRRRRRLRGHARRRGSVAGERAQPVVTQDPVGRARGARVPAGTVFGDPADEAAAARVPATPTPDRAAQAGLTTWAAVGFAGGVATAPAPSGRTSATRPPASAPPRSAPPASTCAWPGRCGGARRSTRRRSSSTRRPPTGAAT